MNKAFSTITSDIYYQQWWDDELKLQNDDGKFGIKVFDEWILKPIFNKKIELSDYNHELLFINVWQIYNYATVNV